MTKKNILIVDDDRTTASVLELHLKNFGYNVAGIASSAKEAISDAGELEPDLVLMDIKLGAGADGIDAATAINRHMDVPIIFVTAHSDSKTLRRAKVVNPAGFINKPIREADIKTTIELAFKPNLGEKTAPRNNASLDDVLKKAYQLTPGEIRVVNKLVIYPDVKSVANTLNISVSTVRTHLKHIYRKTNTNSKITLLHELNSGPAGKLLAK